MPDFFPEDLRARRRTSRSTPTSVREAFAALAGRDRRRAQRRGGRRRLHRHRRRQDGRGDQEDLGRARLRRDPLRAQLLRRRRRPARLRRRRRARHEDGADPSAVLAAVGLWHGARRHPRARAARGSRRRSTTRRSPTIARARRAPRRRGACAKSRRRASPATAIERRDRARTCAMPAPTRRSIVAAGAADGDAARFRDARTRRASASSIADKRAGDRGGHGRGGRRRRRAFPSARGAPTRGAVAAPGAAQPRSSRAARWREARRLPARRPRHRPRVAGPALIIEPHQTIVVEAGWRAEVTPKNHIVLDARQRRAASATAIGTKADPVHARNLQQSVHVDRRADGRRRCRTPPIRSTSRSGSISPARSSTPRARLVANAPHMPVHLGSMDRSVETIIRLQRGPHPAGRRLSRSMRPITAARICPTSPSARRCSTTAGATILFWVASRGHHADIGGIAPGSMCPRATNIVEEGVYIDNFKLVERGRFREKELAALLDGRPLSGAQPAAEHQRSQGADRRQREGRARTAPHGRARSRSPTVDAYMGHVQDNAAESVRRVIDRLKDSEFAVRDGPGRGHQGEDHGRSRARARRRSISPARRRSSRTISTRRSRSRARPCSMSSASWSTTRSR